MASTDRLSFDRIKLDKSTDKMIEWSNSIDGIPLTTNWRNIGNGNPLSEIEERKYFDLNNHTENDPYIYIKQTGLYYFNIYNAGFRMGANVDKTQIAWTGIQQVNGPIRIQVAHYMYWPGSSSTPIKFNCSGMLLCRKGEMFKAVYSKSGINQYNIYGCGTVTCQVVHIKSLEDDEQGGE